MRITIASHNTMHGRFFDALIARYRRVALETPFDILCLQENVPAATPLQLGAVGADASECAHTLAAVIGRDLGHYQCVCREEHPALAILVNADITVKESFLVPLPRLPRLTWFERLYIKGGKAKQKYALVASLHHQREPLTVVNFHLDTAGSNTHRRQQVQAIADALAKRGLTRNVTACGDTNAFTWARNPGSVVVRDIMAPLYELTGAALQGTGEEPTHYFSRQREDLLTHRLLTLVGLLGVDHPLPYDVICSNLQALRSGKVSTEESDHDLVFAELLASTS